MQGLKLAAVVLALSCCGRVRASEATAPSETTSGPVKASARHPTRSGKAVRAAAVKDKKQTAATTPPPWMAVDPGRAAHAPTEGDTTSKSKIPTETWAKDRFDFDSKVVGSNDFQLLPRFDSNINPQGLGGQVGVNLHY